MYSIKNNSINELIIKNSKFITLLYKVDDINKINYYLDKVRETYKDATHYCYAYIISDIKRSSDDNEPSGTAGIPMLDVLEKNNLNNVLAIVVRYFGGIKLGSGGLIRAYSKSVRACLNLVDKVKLTKGYNIDITFDYNDTKKIEYLLKDTTILNKSYNEKITYNVDIDTKYLDILNKNKINYIIKKEVYIEINY